jgi:predicted dehydrogenase/threonine dehydrogenase-like Zn-dependent dehydrogenase
MKQVVQPASGGRVQVLDVPRPVIGPAEVLVRTVSSVISAGTERAITELARANLVAKARARPDLVRQVVRKARTDGVAATARTVRARLATDVPLGYSAAGVVTEVGPAVTGVRPGQLVATGGAGKACHAEFQAVPWLLCTPVPDGVQAQDAAFGTVASIPLHGLRLAGVGPGAKVVVVGLGLIGQLAARLAMAAGCDVAGIDPAIRPREVAAGVGVLALDELGDDTTERIIAWSRGRGADAVLVCAAAKSPAVVARTPVLARDRANIVVVGDVGLDFDRTPFYHRELSLLFARSYGPGRYEPSYEDWGVDYPAGQVRWTEGRNCEAVLDLLRAGRLATADLVTREFRIEEAQAAYELLASQPAGCLAIRLAYQPDNQGGRPVVVRPRPPADDLAKPGAGQAGIGLIGAGAFATGTLLPALRAAGFSRFVSVATSSGLSARRAAERHGFEQAASGADAVIGDPGVGVVVIATPHDAHSALTVAALRAGRHVWCEKPAALCEDGLDEIEKAWREAGGRLTLGFNRRWSPALLAARQALDGIPAPRLVVYRVAAGPVPPGHWYADRRQGGRLIGEACHFIDAAQALAGAEIEEVTGLRGSGDTAVAAVRFAGGSTAVIGYGSAALSGGKEWVEISAGRHRILIDDYRSVSADGRTLWRGHQDKGHRAHAFAFRAAVLGADELPTEAMLATMRATLALAERADGRA